VYFTHWFTSRDRGRALAGLIMAVPFSLALGAPVSGLLLKVHWLGLAGWKWLFLVEGLPAVLLGFADACSFLDDRPRDAKWLAPHERDWLEAQLDAEARTKRGAGDASFWAALRERNVWLLALGIFATNTGGYAFAFWLPPR
jgi:ACS family tartrate transporter-like MFS transporter